MDTPVEHRFFRPLSVEEQQQALNEARAQVDAGQVVNLEEVVRWLKSWGKPDELPPPI